MKKLVQHPNNYSVDLKPLEFYGISTVVLHAQSAVLCKGYFCNST
nr:unnamed protein product [Callosobruchus analis]